MTMRIDSNYSVGQRGAEYEFKVKLSMRVRGVNVTDAQLQEETELAVETAIIESFGYQENRRRKTARRR